MIEENEEFTNEEKLESGMAAETDNKNAEEVEKEGENVNVNDRLISTHAKW